MSDTIILAAAVVLALAVTAALAFTRFGRSEQWLATVTPLASIIGSGFLICGPLLAREFGALAAPAMAVLLLLSYAVGAVIRFNIAEAEPVLAEVGTHHPIAWTARTGQGVLAAAYAVSVAYYLKLLALFALRAVHTESGFYANIIVTVIVVILTILGFTGGLRRVERVADASVSLKLGLIAGMLAALALDWIGGKAGGHALPPIRLHWSSIFLLLGLLITVQGFETSRYMGAGYDRETRIRTMRHAQWISSVIYILFLILLTPRLGQAADTQGVAGVLDVMQSVAPFLGAFVLVTAAASQLSAAVADSIGSTGLVVELSRSRFTMASGYALAGGLALLVTWLTDAFQVIALASRAFALFYAFQCVIGIASARMRGKGGLAWQGFMALVGIACLAAVVAGAPAEG
ncbi:hypothetical protein GCM10023219_15950 [Stakelama sediminis]|uniref:Na+/proline symporter n=1 Tax=Stakelama sediminis TaxID=463200 RepID=A0A840YXM8_9SPHN|nr:hypothetical protein [Stakelama sediminis]MBB5718325.1 hypothetical protein [Stakelama sediminis]